ncbi:hypothetical protein D9M72_561800 [compost metagenome]
MRRLWAANQRCRVMGEPSWNQVIPATASTTSPVKVIASCQAPSSVLDASFAGPLCSRRVSAASPTPCDVFPLNSAAKLSHTEAGTGILGRVNSWMRNINTSRRATPQISSRARTCEPDR